MAEHPVKRSVGTDRDALLAFVREAHAHGYQFVIVAQDVADAFGAPTTMPLPVITERFAPEGCAVAFPEFSMTFLPKESPNAR